MPLAIGRATWARIQRRAQAIFTAGQTERLLAANGRGAEVLGAEEWTCLLEAVASITPERLRMFRDNLTAAEGLENPTRMDLVVRAFALALRLRQDQAFWCKLHDEAESWSRGKRQQMLRIIEMYSEMTEERRDLSIPLIQRARDETGSYGLALCRLGPATVSRMWQLMAELADTSPNGHLVHEGLQYLERYKNMMIAWERDWESTGLDDPWGDFDEEDPLGDGPSRA